MIFAPLAPRRVALLRLAVVVSAFVGIALIQGTQCQAGMPMGTARAQAVAAIDGATVDQCGAVPIDARAEHQVDPGHDSAMGVAGLDAPIAVAVAEDLDPVLPAGLVMACLAAFLALLVVFALPRRGGFAHRVRLVQDVGMTGVRSVLPRAPTLAELCVLRT
ncbi:MULTISPECIES: hypothetical protein [Nocardia]